MTVRSVVRRSTLAGLVGGLVLARRLRRVRRRRRHDAPPTDGRVTVTDVWARTTPPGTTVGAVYLTASSDTADALVGADVDAVDRGVGDAALDDDERLRADVDGGARRSSTSRPVASSCSSRRAATSCSSTSPDSLDDGASFELTLHFATAGDETVTVEVRDEAP